MNKTAGHGSGDNLTVRAAEILARLREEFPDSRCTLHFRNHWELLVATILSAQCTDSRINRITPAFFRRFPDPESTAKASIDEIEGLIRSAGLFRHKARNIREAAREIMEKHKGRVPPTQEQLLQIPGIGRKTANVISGVAFNIPAITVDTHVKRIARRLGLSTNNDPLRIEQDLMKVIPEDSWISLGHLFIDHGRRTCKAKNPLCETCILKDLCPSPDKKQKK